MFCSVVAGKKLDVFFSTRIAIDVCWEVVVSVRLAYALWTKDRPTSPMLASSKRNQTKTDWIPKWGHLGPKPN
jgi:hypothetical protein